MAQKKNHWYIMVLTNEGPKFVTKAEYYPHRVCEWDKNGTPLEMSKEQAQDIALGLCLNFHMAYAVCQPFQIDNQPYHYQSGRFRWETDEVNLDDVVSWIYEHKQVKEDFEAKFPKIAELVKEEE